MSAGLLRVLGVVVVLGALCLASFAEAEQQITVYTPQTSYSLPVVVREGQEYVGLAELLEPLGNVSAKLDGKKWKLRLAPALEAEFSVGKSKAKVHKREIDLTAPFLTANDRGLVPLKALPALLGEFLPGHALEFHQSSRRLFLDKTEVHFTAEIRPTRPSQLVLTFSAPVNPFIATEPGQLHMVFRREPLLAPAGSENISFHDQSITGLSYRESNGTAELTVNGSASLMGSFSSDRKTITITVLQAPVPQTPAPIPPLATGGPPQTPLVAPPKFLVVIDAGHGGSDPGGAITAQLSEKDVTLAWARRLAEELEAHGIATRLLRDADTTLSLDQRSVAANAATPSLFLTLHASAAGNGVRIFTAPLSPSPRGTPAAQPAAFLPWDTAQASFVSTSQAVAEALATELLKRDIPALVLAASVRPLSNVAAPAVALEIAPPVGGGPEEVNAGSYQETVSSAVVAAVAATRAKLPHGEAGR